MSQSHVTQSYDTKKDIKSSRIGDIIQHSKSMLIL